MRRSSSSEEMLRSEMVSGSTWLEETRGGGKGAMLDWVDDFG